jgi:flagellar basal-body rod protein FlgB
MTPCKIFGFDRTKRFHVKLFGKIGAKAKRAPGPTTFTFEWLTPATGKSIFLNPSAKQSADGLSMGPVQLFDLASQQARWLSARQITAAANIANANTPGYKAIDVPPFEAVFNDTSLAPATTSPLHIGLEAMTPDSLAVKEEQPWEVTHSGNSVSLEQELLKSGEVASDYSLNRGIVRSFNQMLMTSLKG